MAGGAVAARYATLGYRGHPITKARRYSTSSGPSAAPAPGAGPGTDPTDDAYTVREALREANPDDPLPLVTFRGWTYAGSGYSPSTPASGTGDHAHREEDPGEAAHSCRDRRRLGHVGA